MSSSPAFLGVQTARPTVVRHLVLAALCTVTMINYIQRYAVGPAETTIRADLGATDKETGNAMGIFFLGYALMQVPSGWLAQRWGARRALTIFTAGWSLTIVLTALMPNITGLAACRLALGVLQAGIFPCATLVLTTWYPATQRGFASAMLNCFMLSGGAVCSWLTALLLAPLGWRLVFALYAVPGLAWAIVFALWFRNRPEDHPQVNPAELHLIRGRELPDRAAELSLAHKEPPAKEPAADLDVGEESIPWAAIFLSAPLIWNCLQQACRSAFLGGFLYGQVPTFLQEVHHLSKEDAGRLASYPLWVAVFSSLVGGVVSDYVLKRTGSRRAGRHGVAVGSLALAIVFFVLAYQCSTIRGVIAMMCVGSFFTNMSSPCAYALTMDMGGRYRGLVFGAFNMAGNLGAWAFLKYTPYLRVHFGWDSTLLVCLCLHIAAIVFWLLINPRGVIGQPTEPEKNPARL